jgi:hypothetical protein
VPVPWTLWVLVPGSLRVLVPLAVALLTVEL